MGFSIQISGVGEDATDPRADRKECLGEGVADRREIGQFSAVPSQQKCAVSLHCTLEPRSPDR